MRIDRDLLRAVLGRVVSSFGRAGAMEEVGALSVVQLSIGMVPVGGAAA
jgi:hypothetical protein